MSETPHLRWFEAYSTCRQCGKPAQGILRGVTNESYGPHCKRCADKRLKDSARVRERDEREGDRQRAETELRTGFREEDFA